MIPIMRIYILVDTEAAQYIPILSFLLFTQPLGKF